MEINEKIIKPFLDSEGRVTVLPTKRSKRMEIYKYLANKIPVGREYSEKEINELLDSMTVFRDHALLRRDLYDNVLLERTKDCSKYWREEETA